MKLSVGNWIAPASGVFALCLLVLQTHAQPAAVTNSPVTAAVLARKLKSPVEAFRELLAMDPAQQNAALTNRGEEARQRLIAKIREYREMEPEDRELRLQATELRWCLPPLMQVPPTERAERLAELRPELRPLVESRLARWDALPADLREQFLKNEQALGYLSQLPPASEKARSAMMEQVPATQREAVSNALLRLDRMTEASRKRAFSTFEGFFELTPQEKQAALRVVSEAEKRQIEKSIEAFGRMSLEQRKQCLQAYEKFAGMSPISRALFLRNVKQWEAMTPKEREQWRELVKRVEIFPPVQMNAASGPPTKPATLPGRTSANTNRS